MPLDARVGRAERDALLPLRARVLGCTSLPLDHAPDTRHWAAWLDDTVVGCVSVMLLRGTVLRGMAVAPEHQRRGIGAALLDAVVDAVHVPMWCNARLAAVPFYAGSGWVAVGPVFPLGGRPHQRMIWTPG